MVREPRDDPGRAAAHLTRCSLEAIGLTGGVMVRRAYQQRSLIEVLLPDADKLWDPTLRRIDALSTTRTSSIGWRRSWGSAIQSGLRGAWERRRPVVLRMLILKRLHDWRFDESEREVRESFGLPRLLPDRRRTVPDAKTMIRLAHL